MDSHETSAPSAARKLYFAAWRWHFYAGLYVIPFLILLSVTGIIIVWFSAIAPEYGEKIALASSTRTLSVTQQTEAALAVYPGGVVTDYVAPYTAENPALVKVTADGVSHVLAINPYSGAVLRDRVLGDTWEEWADHLHGELGLAKPNKVYGDFAIEVSASLALLLVVSGLYMAWPRDGRGMRSMFVPDLSAKGRAFWKSLHLTLGSWASGILILFLISGLSWAGIWGGKFVQAWSTFPAEKWDNVPLSDSTHASMNHTAKENVPWALEQTPMPESGSDAGITGLPEGVAPSFETVAQLARDLGVEGRFQLTAPAGETGVWTIAQDSMNNDSTDPTADRTVHIDRFTGKILADVGFADYSLAGKAMAVGIPLHMGLMGMWNAVFNIGFCLVLLTVSVTSVVMWWKRRPAGAARLAAPPMPADVPLVKGMALIALAMSLAFPVLGITLLAVLLLDFVILSPIPALKRALS